MSEIFGTVVGETPVSPLQMLIRLVVALAFGWLVTLVYRRTRAAHELVPSFSVTLVLLSILIALVTQVIGESIARAFSLVGALSIIRFRTVVRDTQDTAYVICVVALGMAVGQGNLWAAAIGLFVVAVAAFLMRHRHDAPRRSDLPYALQVRMALGHDATAVLAPVIAKFSLEHRVGKVATAKQGTSIEVSYRMALHNDSMVDELVRTLNKTDGVQSVTLERVDGDEEA